MSQVKIEDRISELPEALLVTILSLVPIKDAVTTMLLSKRWSSIWTMIPTLEYKDSEDEENNDPSVCWFLDKSLQLHNAPVIYCLSMELGPWCSPNVEVGNWIVKAVDRRVRYLTFTLLWSADPTRLPNSLYNCATLLRLDLSHKILVDFPSSSCLPSLLALQLFCVVYKDDDSPARFLSSCPALRLLYVKRNNDDNVTKFSVKVPSLRYFQYTNKPQLDDNNDAVDTGGCLVMDTPALNDFAIRDRSLDSYSIENVSCLEIACIDVESLPKIDKLIASFSAVLSLELDLHDEVLERCSTIKFSRLIKLIINPQESDWLQPLMRLLGNVPKLKTLVVDYECVYDYDPDDLQLLWKQPSYVPSCLSSQLEIFEWKGYGDETEEEEFLTYILANSKCLKTATISLRPTLGLVEKKRVTKELKDIPRISTASQLLFK